MTQTNDAENRQMTVMVITEPSTPTFQFGETIADAIGETKKTISSAQNEQDVAIVTNSLYLNGWAHKHGYNATLVNDEEMLTRITNENIPIIMMAPSVENLVIKRGELALLPNEENILVTVQNELLRTDDEDQPVHAGTLITLVLPPECGMVQADSDPDTYVRMTGTPKLSN